MAFRCASFRGGTMKMPAWIARPGVLVLFAALSGRAVPHAAGQWPSPPGTGPGLPETIEAIDSARVTTRILYITAHPDDESAAVLTYLARGLHADVALLSLTRGEGGQNDLGPEQAPQLGLIRTEELLAATRGYGVKLFFTRARDFGFSKTPEETEKVWGDQVLEDMVRVIRTFRPNIVINHFGGVHSGHGHHQTAGLWTPKAVQLAADPKAFASDLERELPRWNGEDRKPIQILDVDRSDNPGGYLVPFDDVSPLWGKTYRQLGLDAFANHRTQGISAFLGSPFLRRPIALAPEGDLKFDPKTLALPLRVVLPGCKAFEEADDELRAARTAALNLDWHAATSSLALAATKAAHWMDKCPWHLTGDLAQRYEVADLNRPAARIEKAFALAAGLQLTAEADRSELVAGENFVVKAQAQCRAEAACTMGETKLVFNGDFKETNREGDLHKGLQFTVEAGPSIPSPLPKNPDAASVLSRLRKEVSPELEQVQPEPSPLVSIQQEVSVGGYTFHSILPVTHVQASSTRVDRVPLRSVPAYTLVVEPKQAIETRGRPGKPFDVLLRVHWYATLLDKPTVGVDVPQGWTASAPVEIAFDGIKDKYVKLTVTPPEKISPGSYTITAYAKRGQEKFSTSFVPLPTMPTQLWSEPAQCSAYSFDVDVPENLRVGYVTAESEPVPEALQHLGISVEMLDASALAFSELSRFDAIVVGVRAYELRSDLPGANQRLLDYVSNGGTLVVQYERDFAWDRAQYAPYPAKISPPPNSPLPRITDENSPVKFLKPDDPLLNHPNKITQDDFKGWVQERGLYFWTQFDPQYTPLLAMNDPGEIDQNGGLVYARYGKGTYIYTGLAFFRQMPEGVSGAYRLFVNLVSASRTNAGSH
jgi:LmbE family N-acetylglucosaminyl deacetylase